MIVERFAPKRYKNSEKALLLLLDVNFASLPSYRFLLPLLEKAIPLLYISPSLFTSTLTFSLMRTMHELLLSHKRKDYVQAGEEVKRGTNTFFHVSG